MMRLAVLIDLFLVAAAVGAEYTSTGASVILNDVYYYISPHSQGKAYDGAVSSKEGASHFGFIPVTLLAQKESEVDASGLFRNWTSRDDVWQTGFLETVLLASSGSKYASNDEKRLSYKGIRPTVLPLVKGNALPSGPYFLNVYNGNVYQAFRLYEDFAGAFTQSLLQNPGGDFQTLSAQMPGTASLTLGVPSRLYFTPTKAKPLAGVRVGVKNIYSLAGVKSSFGSRAYYYLYPPANTTGTAIQNLIDAGAVIVGLQKASQFANGEIATSDWVDYHGPFNPRGDGYQDTASSSAGAGASMGAYQWLDIAVGSDTGGSIRGPAALQGVFGNRPSHGLVSLDHVMPLSPSLDTCGLLVRDPSLWDTANAALYKSNYTSFAGKKPKYPKTLYTLDFPNDTSSSAVLRRKFVTELAKFLQTTVTVLDLDKEWEATAPAAVRSLPIESFLNLTYTALITKDQTRLLRDPFYKDYAAVHQGRLPAVDPSPFNRWRWADTQPNSIVDVALNNKTIFQNWFEEKILHRVSDPLTCSSGILLHVDSTGSFSNRNIYRPVPALPFGYSPGEISVFTEAPDSVLPIGQTPQFSTISNKTEMLPVAVDIMVAKGCDGLIPKLAQDLVKAGILQIPKAGQTINGGQVLF